MAVLNIRAHQFFTCCLQSTTSKKSIISYKPSVTVQAVKVRVVWPKDVWKGILV